jgi:zinc transport system substrate-binding protein
MKKIAAGAILICLLLVSTATPQHAGSLRVKVVASVFPLLEFARAVGGEQAEVSLLLPPGAGVHTWQPRASDIIKMSEADLFIYIGGGLEPWVDDFLRSVSNKHLKILAVASFLPLEKEKHSGEEAADPHVWLDFVNDRTIVDRIAGALAEIDPAQAPAYKSRASGYNEKLSALDGLFTESLKSCAHRIVLLAGHEAFGYLARRYRLQQVSLSGLSPDAEPTPRAVVSLIDLARKQRIGSVFMEARESPKLANLLAREIPAQIFVLNPGENLNKQEWTSGTTFLDLMRENLKNLKKGLGCD